MKILQLLFRAKLSLSIAIGVVVLAIVTVRGCGDDATGVGVAVHAIGGTENPNRRGDVVFVHGLDGDHRITWETAGEPKFFWPEELSKDFEDIGFWSVEYAANSSEWYGGSMPIGDRSVNLLEMYRLKGIGTKPTIFVTHSLGGLVTKQVIVDALTMDLRKWDGIATNTKGVAFLATPHAGSSIATYLERLGKLLLGVRSYRATVQVEELKRNSAMLRKLGNTYKQLASKHRIQILSFFENQGMGGVPPIVDQDSADPGMTGVITTGVDANHASICKPTSREDLVYLSVADFINRILQPPAQDVNVTFGQFLDQYHDAKQRGADALKFFKDDYSGKRVTWDAIVDSRHPADGDEKPFLRLRETRDAPDKVIAVFELDKYPSSLRGGTKITFTGTFSDHTNVLGIVLEDCEMIRVLD